MNICFLCRNFHKDLGGIETFTVNFSQALAESGHTVHIVCENQGDFNRKELGENIFLHHISFNNDPFLGVWTLEKFFPINDLRYSKAAARKIDEIQSEYPLDIVETFDYFRQGYSYCQRKNRLPVFMRLHGWFFNRTDRNENLWPTLNFKEKIIFKMHRNTLLKVDGIAAVAAYTAEFEKKVFKVNLDIATIYNAVDSNSFKPKGEKNPCQVLFAGRLIPRKGIGVLAEAMPLVIEQCPEVKLVIAGADDVSSDGRKNSQMLSERIGHDHLEYLGQVTQNKIKTLLQESAILIMPSLDEAFPMSALEAMASECALITSTVGGLKELINHEKDGLLIEPDNSAMLADAIVRLLKEQELCQKLAAEGLKKVRTTYSYKRLVDESIRNYEKAIQFYNHGKNRK